jgi:hypothetical protein
MNSKSQQLGFSDAERGSEKRRATTSAATRSLKDTTPSKPRRRKREPRKSEEPRDRLKVQVGVVHKHYEGAVTVIEDGVQRKVRVRFPHLYRRGQDVQYMFDSRGGRYEVDPPAPRRVVHI